MKKVLILINDSDIFLAKVCRNKFQKNTGWDAEITSDYDAAIELINTNNPNLVLTELIINDTKGRNGFDLIKDIRKEGKNFNTKIVIFSDLKQESDKEKALELGADFYYKKDEVTMNELIDSLKKVIETE
jgi:DNA-binding response OmpR family regulator